MKIPKTKENTTQGKGNKKEAHKLKPSAADTTAEEEYIPSEGKLFHQEVKHQQRRRRIKKVPARREKSTLDDGSGRIPGTIEKEQTMEEHRG